MSKSIQLQDKNNNDLYPKVKSQSIIDIEIAPVENSTQAITAGAVYSGLSGKSNATNIENGTGTVLVQTTDSNHSLQVLSDGRAKVYGAPTESIDVIRKTDLDTNIELESTFFNNLF